MTSPTKILLAVDVGASSGRVVAALFDGQTIRLEEVFRFENGGVAANDHLYWDVLRQWTSVQQGLRAAHAKYGDRVASVGVDTWGLILGCSADVTSCSGIPITTAINARPEFSSRHLQSAVVTKSSPKRVYSSWS